MLLNCAEGLYQDRVLGETTLDIGTTEVCEMMDSNVRMMSHVLTLAVQQEWMRASD